MKLSQPVQLNQYIQPTCLPQLSTNYPSFNQASYAVGWGSTYYNGPASSLLQNVKLTIYNNTNCNNVFKSLRKDWNLELCAGDLTGNKDTCNGDGGGPLYVVETINGKSKFILAGITAYGYCALIGYSLIIIIILFLTHIKFK